MAGATTTLSWVTFIPQKRVAAPPVGCDYGRGYSFGGDDRSFNPASNRYRTAMHAVIHWSDMSVDGYTSVHSSHVYRQSTGKLVATKTTSRSGMSVKKLPGSSRDYVYIRMDLHASNPFCHAGAIDGALTAKIDKDGSWEFRSGNHRKMPNHEIFIYNSGRTTTLYQSKYQNSLCLIGAAACDLANLTGRYGTYN